jgi:hypothetical protein
MAVRINLSSQNIHTNYITILPAALGRGVYSAPNRIEYQKRKNDNVSGE